MKGQVDASVWPEVTDWCSRLIADRCLKAPMVATEKRVSTVRGVAIMIVTTVIDIHIYVYIYRCICILVCLYIYIYIYSLIGAPRHLCGSS